MSSPTSGDMEPVRQMVRANGVELCAESLGNPANPAILLIHGAAASMMAWDDDVYRSLAAGGRFVIRYDHRDSGQSVGYPPGTPGYTFRDLAADALGLLDVFSVDRAHLVGISLGGGLAQLAAVEHPERVASLTLIATSPGGPDLPPMSDAFLAHVSGTAPPDWSDQAAVLDHILALLQVMRGTAEPYDEAALRAQLDQELDRTVNIASSQINHFTMEVGEPVRGRLRKITAPTLVIHGDIDPVFPLGHAQALEQEIPGARLLVLEQTGHILHPAAWEVAVSAILAHTAAAERAAAP